jgi:hypothetical protein
MKAEAFKKIIKSAVKEAIQEELKEILLENFKSSNNKPLQEQINTPQPLNSPPPSSEELRQKYLSILGETSKSFTTSDISPFNPHGVHDPINGNLGEGEVGLDQISKLLNNR